MTVKTKVRNRKQGVNVEVNIKNENNQQSKNKYVPHIPSWQDDGSEDQPPNQSYIQHYIPYFNKNLSFEPQYNNKKYNQSSVSPFVPEGSTEIPQNLDAEQMLSDIQPNYNSELISQQLNDDVQQEEGEASAPEDNIPTANMQTQDEVSTSVMAYWPISIRDKYKDMDDEKKRKFLRASSNKFDNLLNSFLDGKNLLSAATITKYGLWGVVQEALNGRSIANDDALGHYSTIFNRRVSRNQEI